MNGQEEMLRVLGLMRPQPSRIISPTAEQYEREPVLTAEGLDFRIRGLEPLSEEEYSALPQDVRTELEAFFGEVDPKRLSKLQTPADVEKIEELVGLKEPWFLDPAEWVAGGAVGIWKTPLRMGMKTIARELGAEITMGASELVRAAPMIGRGLRTAGKVLAEEVGAIGKAITPKGQKWLDVVVEYMKQYGGGYTTDPAKALWILPDGRMVNTIEHQGVYEALDAVGLKNVNIRDFMRETGGIRVVGNEYSSIGQAIVEGAKSPTEAQMQVLEKHFVRKGKPLIIDFFRPGDPKVKMSASKELAQGSVADIEAFAGEVYKGWRSEEGFLNIQGQPISRAILAKSRELQERLGIRKYIIPRVDDLDKETRMIFLSHRARMAERRGDIAKAVKPLKDLSEEELDFSYHWLTIDDDYALADALGIPKSEIYGPKWKKARDASVKVRKAFMDLGLEATETPAAYGKALLKADKYYEKLTTYLPDMAYIKEYPHLFGPEILDLTQVHHLRKFRTDLSRFMKNRDIIKRHKEEMLQITDARYLSSKGLWQVANEIETAKLYNSLEEVPGNVFNDLEALESFQNQFRESFEKAGINVEEGLKKLGIHRSQFTRVADDPAHLGLANKLVRKDIGDTLSDMRPEQLGRISRLMDNFLNPWRIGKVVLRTGTHGRNLFSNLILNDIGGLPFYRMDIYGRALNDLVDKGKYYKIAREKGLLLPTYSHEEVGRLQRAFNEKEGVMSVFHKIVKPATDLYQAEEQWFKLAKFMYHMEHEVKQGVMDVDDAVLAALESTFDYGTRAKGQAAVRRWAMPFATWTYKMAPYLARKSVEHPLRVGKWVAGIAYAQYYAAEKVLGSKEEWRELYKRFPEYQQGKNFMLIPFRDKLGRLQMLDLTYMLPWGDVAELKSQGLERVLQNPVIATMADLTRNRDFADREIVRSYEKGEKEQYLRWAFHTYRAMTPTGFPGNYDWEMIARTWGESPERGTKTPAQATLAMLGLKITPMTKREVQLSHVARHEVERNELIADWNRDVKAAYRPGERSEIIRKYRTKLDELDREFQERLRHVPAIGKYRFLAEEAKRFIIP